MWTKVVESGLQVVSRGRGKRIQERQWDLELTPQTAPADQTSRNS